jgi:hypothetical protein
VSHTRAFVLAPGDETDEDDGSNLFVLVDLLEARRDICSSSFGGEGFDEREREAGLGSRTRREWSTRYLTGGPHAVR